MDELTQLKNASVKRIKAAQEDDSLPTPIADLLGLLRQNEQKQSGFVTRKRIVSHLEDWGRVINQWITYPDLFIDLITPLNSEFTLYPFQRIFMREMSRKNQTYITASRGTSKSFCGFVERYLHAMLIPRHRTGIIAGTRKQAASIAKEKIIDDIWNKFPFLANEMQKRNVAGKQLDAYTAGQDYARFGFRNGSWLDVASDRGLRRESILFEEIIEQDPTFVNEIAIPWVNKPRSTSLGTINPLEPQSQKIFVTTAGYQGTFAYDKLIQTLIMSVIQPEHYSVIMADYKLPLYHGLLQQSEVADKLNDPTYDRNSFDREYNSIWSDAPTGAAFKASTITALRKIKRIELTNKINPQITPHDFYVIAVDMAKDGDAKTAGVVARVRPGDFNFNYRIVNLFQIDSTDYSTVANQLKLYILKYNAKLLVYDANGVGASLRDWLNKPTTDSDGINLPGFGIINPPDAAKTDLIEYPNDRTIIYEIKSGGTVGSNIHRFFFGRISNRSILFPITISAAIDLYNQNKTFLELSRQRQTAILAPYRLMDLAEAQLKNLDIDATNNTIAASFKIIRRNASIQKDFFSALEYLTWGVNQQLENDYYKRRYNRSNTFLDAIFCN